MPKILIVDDEIHILEYLEEILMDNGHKVITAFNGKEALEKFKKEKVDLVITDLNMPELKGDQLIEQIRAIPEAKKKATPIIVATGCIKDIEFELAFSEILTLIEKPFSEVELMNTVRSMLNPKTINPKFTKEFVLQKGQVLMKEGEIDYRMFWIKSGLLEVYREESSSKIVLAKLKTGDIVGELAFIDHRPRSASVMALETTTLNEIPYQNFFNLLNELPPWLKKLIKSLCERLRTANKRIF